MVLNGESQVRFELNGCCIAFNVVLSLYDIAIVHVQFGAMFQ